MVACSVSLLWFTVRPGVVHPGRVWPIYAVIFVSGIARSFLQPARTALSAEVVPRELYPNAVTWRSSTWQLAAVLGPALGGLIYGFGNARAAYAVDVALMVGALLAVARIEHVPRLRAPSSETIRESLVGGIRFVRSQPVLAMKFIELLCARLRWTSDQVEQIILQNLPGRLASALLRLTEKHKLGPQGRTIAITQQEISEMVGMTRESINKQLRAWAARDWVRLEHGAIVVLKAEPLQTLVDAGSGDEGE